MKTISVAEFVRKLRASLAAGRWIRFAERQPLEDLGLSPDLIPRRGMRGQPRKIRHTDEQIVQLVYKQQLQGGRPFTNAAGADNNPCFTGVADFHGVHVSAVRAAWERVPAQRRREIKTWLQGELTPRHKKKSE